MRAQIILCRTRRGSAARRQLWSAVCIVYGARVHEWRLQHVRVVGRVSPHLPLGTRVINGARNWVDHKHRMGVVWHAVHPAVRSQYTSRPFVVSSGDFDAHVGRPVRDDHACRLTHAVQTEHHHRSSAVRELMKQDHRSDGRGRGLSRARLSRSD